MAAISGFPYFEIEFDKKGAVHDPAQRQALLDFVARGQNQATDLLVLSHGWNNDMADARDLYRRLLARLRDGIDGGKVPGVKARKFAVCAVLWPSKKFTEKELIPSGAASAGGVVSTQALQEEIDRVKDAFDSPTAAADLDKARALVPKLEDSKAARDEFAQLLRSVLQMSGDPGKIAGDADEETPSAFFTLPGSEIIQRLSKPLPLAPAGPGGGAAGGVMGGGGTTGGAAGLGILSGIKGGAMKLLNLTTYYQMKERAGLVGREGLNPILREVRAKRPDLKLHLIGHSFGGRLVTAATLGPDGAAAVKPDSLTLLQAAFSHYGFSQGYDPGKDGFFRKVVSEKRIAGPVLATYTHNDKAVGKAYPIASQLAGQVAAALGDKNSRWGGIGANGAQKTPEAVDGKLLPVGGSYSFTAGKVHNLNADSFIKDHSDITRDEVAHAVLTAIAAT